LNNVIYTIKTKELDSRDWWKISLPTIEAYAEKVGADLRIITEMTDNIPNPYFLLFECLWDFERSDYDRILFLDLDIEVSEKAPNIFEAFANGFHIRDDIPFRKATDLYPKWLAERNVEYSKRALKNTGVILADKPDIVKFNQIVPKNLNEFYESNFINYGSDRQFRYLSYTEQPYFCYFLIKSKVKIYTLDSIWDQDPGIDDNTYFIHYTGGQKRLLEDKYQEALNGNKIY